MILTASASPFPIDSRFPAGFLRPNGPGLPKRIWILNKSPSSRSKIIFRHRVKITTQTTESFAITRGCRDLNESNSIPEYLDTDLGVHQNAVSSSVDLQLVRQPIRDIDLHPIHFDSHPLPEIYSQVSHLQVRVINIIVKKKSYHYYLYL